MIKGFVNQVHPNYPFPLDDPNNVHAPLPLHSIHHTPMIIDSNATGNFQPLIANANNHPSNIISPSQQLNVNGGNGDDVENLISKRWLDLEVQKQHHLAQYLYFQQLAEQEEITRATVTANIEQPVSIDLDVINAQGGAQKTSAWIASHANGGVALDLNLNNGPSPKTIVAEEEQNLNELLSFVGDTTTPSLSPKQFQDTAIITNGQSPVASPATIASRSSFSSSSVDASVATPRSSIGQAQSPSQPRSQPLNNLFPSTSPLETVHASTAFVPKDLANAFRPSAPLLASSTRGSKDWTDITSYAALYNTNTDLALGNGSDTSKLTYGGKDMQRSGQEQSSSTSSSLEGNNTNNTAGAAPSAIGGSQFVKSFTPVQSPYGRGASLPGFDNHPSGNGVTQANMAAVGMNSGTINPYSSGGMGLAHHYASPASAIRTTGNAGMDNGMIGYGYMPYGGYNQMGPQQGSYMGGMSGYSYNGEMGAPPPMHMGEMPMTHGNPGNGYMPEVIGASQYMRHGAPMGHDALGEYHRNMAKENAGKVHGFSGSNGVKMESVSQSPQLNHAQRGSFGTNAEEDEIADDGEMDDLEAEMEAALDNGNGNQRTVGRPSKQAVSNSTRSAPYDLDSSRNRASLSGSTGSAESGSKSARQYISKNILFEDGKPKVRNPLGGGRGYVPGQTPDDPRKRHKCDICGRAFARLYNLKSHASTHDPTRTKPFSCPHADCTRSFSRLHDLERHRQGIHADGPLMEARILGVSPAFARAQARMDSRTGSSPGGGPPADSGPGAASSGMV